MAISITRYVNITSVVGAQQIVPVRQLIGRMFTTNTLVPTASVVTFDTLAEVGSYFGTTSQEYLRAQFYFGFVSKNGIIPPKLSFSRWTTSAEAPMIFGQSLSLIGSTLSTFTAITSGAFVITVGGTTHTVSGLNFSSAVSLSGVATIIQTAVQAIGGSQFATATVTYDNTLGGFDFVGGDSTSPTPVSISVTAAGSGTDISRLMGWSSTGLVWPNGPIYSYGNPAETITQTLTTSAATDGNFGSFCFVQTITQQNVVDASTWNSSQNVQYVFCVPVTAANAAAYNTALLSLAGTAVTLAPLTTEYPEQIPMMVLAATDYTAANSVQNYMFQQVNGLTPSVTDDATANTLDSENTNYYGQTQSAGQNVSFYQRGLMSGSSVATNPTLLNIYANEMWLKSSITASIMNLLLAVSKVSTNAQGEAQILAVIQSVINQAVTNGTISVGTQLSSTQQAYVTQITNDPNAWRQVQNIGYWVNVTMQTIPNTSPVQYQAVYTLVYKKDDVVNKVVGTQILI